MKNIDSIKLNALEFIYPLTIGQVHLLVCDMDKFDNINLNFVVGFTVNDCKKTVTE